MRKALLSTLIIALTGVLLGSAQAQGPRNNGEEIYLVVVQYWPAEIRLLPSLPAVDSARLDADISTPRLRRNFLANPAVPGIVRDLAAADGTATHVHVAEGWICLATRIKRSSAQAVWLETKFRAEVMKRTKTNRSLLKATCFNAAAKPADPEQIQCKDIIVIK